jgi:hypothetical protein
MMNKSNFSFDLKEHFFLLSLFQVLVNVSYAIPFAYLLLNCFISASLKSSTRKRRETSSSQKSLPPSKRLRLEAQRVLKEKVMEIAEKKGLKLKFCRLGPCEEHIQTSDSPCNSIREELGWPPTVPFVHPHDLPNKAKIAFLEAYEPGWSTSQQNVE